VSDEMNKFKNGIYAEATENAEDTEKSREKRGL